MIYLLRMVIFHSCVSLPEGKCFAEHYFWDSEFCRIGERCHRGCEWSHAWNSDHIFIPVHGRDQRPHKPKSKFRCSSNREDVGILTEEIVLVWPCSTSSRMCSLDYFRRVRGILYTTWPKGVLENRQFSANFFRVPDPFSLPNPPRHMLCIEMRAQIWRVTPPEICW